MVLRAEPLAPTPAAAKVTALADAILHAAVVVVMVFAYLMRRS